MAESLDQLIAQARFLKSTDQSLFPPIAVSQAKIAVRQETAPCSYDDAFEYLQKNLNVDGLTLETKRGVGGYLVIKPSGIGLGNDIFVECAGVPCFVKSIPEMLTSYIIAQILRIAQVISDKGDVLFIISEVRSNWNAKIVVLHQMNDYYSTRMV